MCTRPIKAYHLNKDKIFEHIRNQFIETEEARQEARKITNELWNKEGIGEKHFYKRICWKRPKNDLTHCYDLIELPCNKCEECLLNRAKDWALRCMLEAQDHKQNCFLTLTYNDKNLPTNRAPNLKDFQNFMKRLRKYLSARQGGNIKYLAAGEVGPRTLRGHFHVCLFGWMPEDLKYYKKNDHEQKLYTSKILNKIWGKGYTIIGALTYESASYVARYCTKKLKNGNKNEYIVMSRKPGIAANYLTKNKKEIWNDNGIYIKTANGAKLQNIPKYLKKKIQEEEDKYEINKYNLRKNILNQEQKENQEEILKNTTLNQEEILKQRENKMKFNLKILKRNAC